MCNKEITQEGVMTLNEKLDVIADLEEENLAQELIESIVDQLENPEPLGKRYKTAKELIEDLESDED